MILHLRRALVLVSLGCVALAAPLEAQIQVTAQMTKRDFLANEPVTVTITLTNRAGRDIFVHGSSRQSWLDFDLKNSRGVPLTTLSRRGDFKAVNLPAGRSVSQTVNIGQAYRLSAVGRYGGYATVRLPGPEKKIYTSNRIHFNVTDGRLLYKQTVGVPELRTSREYRVISFSNKGKSHIYVGVHDEKTGQSVRTFSLGEALMFRKPEYTVDGKNNLQVLFMGAPEVWVHARVSPKGELLGRDLFKRGAVGNPRLVTFANGEVKTGGGIFYDPRQEQVQQARIRRLSERPAVTYR